MSTKLDTALDNWASMHQAKADAEKARRERERQDHQRARAFIEVSFRPRVQAVSAKYASRMSITMGEPHVRGSDTFVSLIVVVPWKDEPEAPFSIEFRFQGLAQLVTVGSYDFSFEIAANPGVIENSIADALASHIEACKPRQLA